MTAKLDYNRLKDLFDYNRYILNEGVRGTGVKTKGDRGRTNNSLKTKSSTMQKNSFDGTFTFNDGVTVKAPFQPNEQQAEALNAMDEFLKSDKEHTMTLSGYAGTGKTSIMEIFAQKARQDRHVVFCASTNKAAAVLKNKVSKYNFTSVTLNKIFGISVEIKNNAAYNAKNLQTILKEGEVSYNDVVIIDEASMINENNYDIIEDYARQLNLKIIYIGDPAQLPPVNEAQISKVFRNLDNRIVTLTKVERTGDNAILKEATAIREGKPFSKTSSFNDENEGVAFVSKNNRKEIERIINHYVKELKNNSEYFRVLAYTNEKVNQYNNYIRRTLGYSESIPKEGEPLMGYSNWGYNWKTKSYKIINSESYKVVKMLPLKEISLPLNSGIYTLYVTPIILQDSTGKNIEIPFVDIQNNEHNKKVAVQLGQLKQSLWRERRKFPYRNKQILSELTQIDHALCIKEEVKDEHGNVLLLKNIDFGYAMTIHKSQGSTFEHVLIDDIDIRKAENGATLLEESLNIDIKNETDEVDFENVEMVGEEELKIELDEEEISPVIASENQSNSLSLVQQLEYVAISRASKTATVLTTDVIKEGSPLSPENSQIESTDAEELPVTEEAETEDSLEDYVETPFSTTLYLSQYAAVSGKDGEVEINAEWKVPLIQNLERSIDANSSVEERQEIADQIEELLQADPSNDLTKKSTSEETRNRFLESDEEIQTQFNNLFNSDVLTYSEIKEAAEQVMDFISDEISLYQQNPQLPYEKYTCLKTSCNFATASRKEIVEAIGINRLLNYAKLRWSQLLPKNIDDLPKIDLIVDNWEAVLLLGSSVFMDNEGFGINRNANTNLWEITDSQYVEEEDFNNNFDSEIIRESEGDLQEHWQIESRSIDPLNNASTLVRIALHSCYELDKQGNKIMTFWQIPKRVQPRQAAIKIYHWVKGSTSLSEMVAKLQQQQKRNPWLTQLLEALTDSSGNMSDFQSQFFTVFCKDFQKYAIGIKDSNNYHILNVNDSIALSEAMNSIIVQYKIKQHPLFSSEGKVNINLLGKKGIISDSITLHKIIQTLFGEEENFGTKDSIRERIYKNQPLSPEMWKTIISNIAAASKILGYPATEEMWESALNTANLNKVLNALCFTVQDLDKAYTQQNQDKKFEYQPFTFGSEYNIANSLRNFLTPIADILEENKENAVFDSGKLYQSFVTPSYLTQLLDKFHDENTERWQTFMEENYANSEWFFDSNDGWQGSYRTPWLKKMMVDNNRFLFDHKVELNFNKHNFMRTMTEQEYILSVITEYYSASSDTMGAVPAWFRIPLMSNKPSSEFIKFLSYRGMSYKESIVDDLYQVFLQECDRIITVRKMILKDKISLVGYEDQGLQFCFLPELNVYLKGSETASLNDSEKDGNSSENNRLSSLLSKFITKKDSLIEEEQAELESLVKKVLYDLMEKHSENILDEYKEFGILEEAKKIENLVHKELRDDESSVREAVKNFLWNDRLAAINILQITVGDIAFFENSEALSKRLAQLHSPGIRPNVEATDYQGHKVSDGFYRTLVISDFENYKSNLLDNLAEVFDKKIAAAPNNEKEGWEILKEQLIGSEGVFTEINVTDGQGFSSPSSYRKKAIMFGKWSKDAEATYQRLKNNKFTLSDIKTVFGPFKPFETGFYHMDSGVEDAPISTFNVSFQAKNSEYLLIMADALLQGQDTSRPNLLNAIFKIMEDSYEKDPTKGIDTVQFASAIKVGLPNSVNLLQFMQDPNGSNNAYTYIHSLIYQEIDGEPTYNPAFIKELPYRTYCLQQEVPNHFLDHFQIHGSQIRATVPSDLQEYYSDGTPVYYEFDEPDGTHKKLTKKEFIKEYESTIAESADDSLLELEQELHLSGTKKEQNIALSRILQREILNNISRYGIDLLQACSIDKNTGDFYIPKGDPIQAKRIEQLINSIIKNRINKQKIAGGPAVQVSNFGLSKQLNVIFKDKNGNLLKTKEEWEKEHEKKKEEKAMSADSAINKFYDRYKAFSNKTYQEYVQENQAGVAYYECYLSAWSKEIFQKFMNPEDGTIDLKAIEELNPDLLEMIGYRIPTEAKYSCTVLKCKGFLPREAGDCIMMPYELTAINDSDFDIDKEFILRKVIYIKTKNKKEIMKSMWKVIKTEVPQEISLSEEEKRVIIEDYKNKVKGLHLNEEAFKQGLVAAFEDANRKKPKPTKDELWQFIQDPQKYVGMNEWYNKLWKLYKEVAYFCEEPKSGKLYRDNKIITMTKVVFQHETQTDQMLNPGGFELLKKWGYGIATFKFQKGATSWEELQMNSVKTLKSKFYRNKDLTWFDTHTLFYAQNSSASTLLSIAAATKTSHCILENDNLYIDVKEICGRDFAIADFIFSGRLQLDPINSKEGTLISKSLGMSVGASADAAKTPVFHLMNINQQTMNILNTMLRLGMPEEDALLFLSNDVLIRAVKKWQQQSLTGYSSLINVIQEMTTALFNDFAIDNESSLNTENLTKRELIAGLLETEHPEIDYKVLIAFQNLYDLSLVIKKPTFVTRFNSIATAVGPLIVDNLILEHKMEDFRLDNMNNTSEDTPSTGIYTQDGTPADFFTILDNHPMLNSFVRTVFLAKDLFADMPIGGTGFRSLLQMLPDDLQNKMFNDRKLLTQLADFYQSYLLVASGFINSKHLKNYMQGFVPWFEKQNYKEKYADNALIQVIQTEVHKNSENLFLKIDTVGMKQPQKDKLGSAWIDLYKKDPDLAVRLAVYNFFRGGIGFNPKTFMSLLPLFVKRNWKMKNANGQEISYLDVYKHLKPVDSNLVIDQFVQNNSDNYKIAPLKQNKHSHFEYNWKQQTLTVADPQEMKEMGNSTYIKTIHKGVTFLWKLFIKSKEKLVYKNLPILGYNKEYLEISTEPVIKPLDSVSVTDVIVENTNDSVVESN